MTKNSFSQPIFVGDIGATNARFSYITSDNNDFNVQYFVCAEYQTFEDLLEAFLSTISNRETLTKGAIAVAAPVIEDSVKFTNLPWSFSIQELKKRFSLDSLFVINDYEAVAKALPYLESKDLKPINSPKNNVNPSQNLPKVVLGPGSGLGSAALIPYTWDNILHWAPISGEAGHMSLSSLNTTTDSIIEQLRKKLGNVSLEDVLSGPGILNLYSILFSKKNRISYSSSKDEVEGSNSSLPPGSKTYPNKDTISKFEGITDISIGEHFPKKTHSLVDSIITTKEEEVFVTAKNTVLEEFKNLTAAQISLLAIKAKNIDPCETFKKNLPSVSNTTPKEILSICSETMEYFFQLLGASAGNLALAFNAKGGVYLAGGILPQVENLLSVSSFKNFFQAKGSYTEYMSDIPVHLIIHPAPALVGLVRLLWEKLEG